ncbi:hypothetical protein ACT6QH_09085 [Xanthobacter sp. TB0139]|uniref:hypothetical protein n=1 Tax=Xanthobacter sp. TB0139 TaxID=3459178 RepID=UPI00403952BC
MKTIYLRFADRNAALAGLYSVLGYAPDMESGALPTVGRWQNSRFDVDEVGELLAVSGWHINILWWGDAADAPDFGPDEISPQTPSRVFAL